MKSQAEQTAEKRRAALAEKRKAELATREANELAARFYVILVGRARPEGYLFYATRQTPDARTDKMAWDLAVAAFRSLRNIVPAPPEDPDAEESM